MQTEVAAEKAPFKQVEAAPISLLGGPISNEAKAFIGHLTQLISEVRPSSLAKARSAMGALLADLFDLRRNETTDKRPMPGAHGMSPKDFPASTLGFGRDIFLSVIKALQDNGLITIIKGEPRWMISFGRPRNINGQVTTFSLTSKTLSLAASYGVEHDMWSDHWEGAHSRAVAPPKEVQRLILRGKKARNFGKKTAAVDLPVDQTAPEAAKLLNDLEFLNSNLLKHDIGGIAFSGLRRIFSNGDQSDFAWNKGGRFYSLPGGHAYEMMGAEHRLERIRLNGNPVGEADIRASHLTLFHALLGRPFAPSQDPYEISGLDRNLVKWWCTQALGSSNPMPRQCPTNKKESYASENEGIELQKHFPIREVGRRILQHHPGLADLDTCGITTLDLQFHESQILAQAMKQLLTEDIPALPIHDGLIIAIPDIPKAQEAILSSFKMYIGELTNQPATVTPLVVPKLL